MPNAGRPALRSRFLDARRRIRVGRGRRNVGEHQVDEAANKVRIEPAAGRVRPQFAQAGLAATGRPVGRSLARASYTSATARSRATAEWPRPAVRPGSRGRPPLVVPADKRQGRRASERQRLDDSHPLQRVPLDDLELVGVSRPGLFSTASGVLILPMSWSIAPRRTSPGRPPTARRGRPAARRIR